MSSINKYAFVLFTFKPFSAAYSMWLTLSIDSANIVIRAPSFSFVLIIFELKHSIIEFAFLQMSFKLDYETINVASPYQISLSCFLIGCFKLILEFFNYLVFMNLFLEIDNLVKVHHVSLAKRIHSLFPLYCHHRI